MSSLEHFNNKKYVCSFCGFRTHKKYNLDVHKKNKHRASTTVSIPPLYGNGVQAAATHQHTSNPHVHPYLNHTNQSIPSNWFIAQHPHEYEYAKETSAPTKVSVGPDCQPAPTKIRVGPNEPMPPTTISVPPIREQVSSTPGSRVGFYFDFVGAYGIGRIFRLSLHYLKTQKMTESECIWNIS